MKDKLHLMHGLTLDIGDCFYEKTYNYKYHIVAILDEEPEKMIVYKYYGDHKQWWHYEIKSLYSMNLWFESGLYFIKEKENVR